MLTLTAPAQSIQPEIRERDLEVARQRYLCACVDAAKRIDLSDEAIAVGNAVKAINILARAGL